MNEIRYRHKRTGRSLYAVLWRLLDGLVWNGSAWEEFKVSHWSAYAMPLTETPTGGFVYVADAPRAGLKSEQAYELGYFELPEADGGPQTAAPADLTDLPLQTDRRFWTGAQLVPCL